MNGVEVVRMQAASGWDFAARRAAVMDRSLNVYISIYLLIVKDGVLV